MKILEYNRTNATDYAKTWAKKRNPIYYNFDGIGGDCTNFVSQCIYAGSSVMNYEKVFGWYYNSINDRTPSWTGVEFLYLYLIKKNRPGPFASLVDKYLVELGDVVQLGNSNGEFFHTAIVTGFLHNNDILVSSHSRDFFNVPLYVFNFSLIRYLHIEGVYLN